MARKINKNKLIHGWGVNDVGYDVTQRGVVEGKNKIIWRCPYYVKWYGILQRCFSHKVQMRRPNYRGCTVAEEWKYLSNFIKWVDSQPNKDWANCQPDKDILSEGNKHYSPETVVFVTNALNNFIQDCRKSRGKYMIGVCLSQSKSQDYRASCSNPFTGKRVGLGVFKTEIEAHLAWKSYKHKMACLLAEQNPDPRMSEILKERYAPDKDWTNK